MFEKAYTPSSLRRHLRKSDFKRSPWLRDKVSLANFLRDSAAQVNAPSELHIELAITKKRGKRTYLIPNFKHELLLRKAAAELNGQRSGSRFSRELIVGSLRSLLEDAVPHRVFRFDIKAFFESIDIHHLLSAFESELSSSPVTHRLVKAVLRSSRELGGTGVPRGVGLSQALAELSLAEFDEKFRFDDDVVFYGRYVDDIVIVTEESAKRRQLLNRVLERLPEGTSLNQRTSKRAVVDCPRSQKMAQLNALGLHQTSHFSYLGYKFSISHVGRCSVGQEKKNGFRTVSLDIADSKIKRIKTRLVHSARDYLKSLDFDLFLDRVKFLSSNYSLPEKTKRHKRLGGIFYNYPLVDSEDSTGLLDLDRFMRAMVLSQEGGVFKELANKLDHEQKARLLCFSFKEGFDSRRMFHFSRKRISAVLKCWQGG